MRFPSRQQVEMIRKQYPAGSRVELVQMDDMQAPPAGTRGTVTGVDDTGSIMVSWDNGSGLNVALARLSSSSSRALSTFSLSAAI